LRGSSVPSLRELRRGFEQLCVLDVSACGLRDLTGIDGLTRLCELRAAANAIDDLSPLSGHGSLEVLELDGNPVASPDTIEFLADLPRLRALSLSETPLARRVHYRALVGSRLQQLRLLDKAPVCDSERLTVSPALADLEHPPLRTASALASGRPCTLQRTDAASPDRGRASRLGGDDGDASRNEPASPSSDLTYGSDEALCGSFVQALRRRRKNDVLFAHTAPLPGDLGGSTSSPSSPLPASASATSSVRSSLSSTSAPPPHAVAQAREALTSTPSTASASSRSSTPSALALPAPPPPPLPHPPLSPQEQQQRHHMPRPPSSARAPAPPSSAPPPESLRSPKALRERRQRAIAAGDTAETRPLSRQATPQRAPPEE
jgi:hypothetical protein